MTITKCRHWEDLLFHAESQAVEEAYSAACAGQHGYASFVGHLWYRRLLLFELFANHSKTNDLSYDLVMHARPYDTVLSPVFDPTTTRRLLRGLLAEGAHFHR